jgi:hypothetical protein
MTDLCPIDRMIADLIAEVGPEHARAVAPTEARVALCDLLRTYTPRWLRSRWAVVA